MNSKLGLWFGGAVGLLLVGVLATCGNDAPVTTGVDDSVGLMQAGKGVPVGPRVTDPNPASWQSPGEPLSHDGFPTDITFEGLAFQCFDPVGEAYAGFGVHFSGEVAFTDDGCLNSFNYPPHSPITSIGAISSPTITIDFDVAQTDVGIRYNSLGAISMSCFNSVAVLVGTDVGLFPNLANFGPSIAPPNELLRVVGADIRQCVITATPNFYTLDDLFADNVEIVDIIGETCQGFAVSPGVTSFTFNGLTTIIGTDGSDVISGTDHADMVVAKGGDDLICTFFGPDVVDGGPDNDTVFGGPQADRIFGKEGRDVLFGEAGQDRIDGGHTPVPSSLPDTQPDICIGGTAADRYYLCETIIDQADK